MRITFLLVLLLRCIPRVAGYGPAAQENYSFSLTTFDPSGKLGQVERAGEAASNGVPIVGVLHNEGVIFASPRILPSPLIEDDGACRFLQITPEIMMGHSGISGDGRAVLKAAQTIAIQHRYTFDQEIRINTFLEELSLLFQEYTMKAGARPFGCTVLVANVPDSSDKPRIFQLEPSGSIRELKGSCLFVNAGKLERTSLGQNIDQLLETKSDAASSTEKLAELVKSAIDSQSRLSADETKVLPDIVTASLCHPNGFLKGVYKNE